MQTDTEIDFKITNIGLDNITFYLNFTNPGSVSRNGKESEAVF